MIWVLDFQVVTGLKRMYHSFDSIRVVDGFLFSITKWQETSSIFVKDNEVMRAGVKEAFYRWLPELVVFMSELDEASFNLDDKDCIEVDVNAFVADNKLSCLILCASLDNQQLKGCIANFKFILPLYQKLWSLADRWHTCFKLQKEIP